MRKLLVSVCFSVALLVSSALAPAAKADHGYYGGFGGGYGAGHGAGYGAGYGAPSCHSRPSGYGSHYSNYGVSHYQTAIVPVYPGGIYQSYSFGGSPFGGYSNFGHAGFPYGAQQYGVGYGSYRSNVPRVQLRIGF